MGFPGARNVCLLLLSVLDVQVLVPLVCPLQPLPLPLLPLCSQGVLLSFLPPVVSPLCLVQGTCTLSPLPLLVCSICGVKIEAVLVGVLDQCASGGHLGCRLGGFLGIVHL